MKATGLIGGDGSITVNIDQRKLAFERLGRIPEDFIRRMSCGDQAAIDSVLAATEPNDATQIGTPFRTKKR